MRVTPRQQVIEALSGHVPDALLDEVPYRWKRIGDVLVISLPEELRPYRMILGETFGVIFGCRSVLEDVDGIDGVLREPQVELIWGDPDTVTTHNENGVLYRLDPQKVMFSAGNVDERIRMARIDAEGEVVVDMFAGIGYFTIPLAKCAAPSCVVACELNPDAVGFLRDNVVLNGVEDIVEVHEGDNRMVTPVGCADRVVMGYFGGTLEFLPTAFRALKDRGGIIHFHDVFDTDEVDGVMDLVSDAAKEHDRVVSLISAHIVKSFAPGRFHMVYDIEVR